MRDYNEIWGEGKGAARLSSDKRAAMIPTPTGRGSRPPPHDSRRSKAATPLVEALASRERLAYVELHRDERAATITGFLERALAFFQEHGIVCKRLMTDNAFGYVKSRSLREPLAARGIKHPTTEPYRPRTNGKVERLHQTMAREWAYASPTAHIDSETRRCHTGSTTTTGADHTAHLRSAAFTTCVARTASAVARAGGTSRFPQTPSTGPLRGQGATRLP